MSGFLHYRKVQKSEAGPLASVRLAHDASINQSLLALHVTQRNPMEVDEKETMTPAAT